MQTAFLFMQFDDSRAESRPVGWQGEADAEFSFADEGGNAIPRARQTIVPGPTLPVSTSLSPSEYRSACRSAATFPFPRPWNGNVSC